MNPSGKPAERFALLAHEVTHTAQFYQIHVNFSRMHDSEALGFATAVSWWVSNMGPSIYHNVLGRDIYTAGPGGWYEQTYEQQAHIIGQCFGFGGDYCDHSPLRPGAD
jgi:hypothetical protein